MNPYDAVFFAAAVSVFAQKFDETRVDTSPSAPVEPSSVIWTAKIPSDVAKSRLVNAAGTVGVMLAPALAWLCLPLGPYASPVAALAATFVGRRFFPAAALLVVPSYTGWTEAVVCGVLWGGLSMLLYSLSDRFAEVSPSLRGVPIRLVTLGVLYYTLLPLRYL